MNFTVSQTSVACPVVAKCASSSASKIALAPAQPQLHASGVVRLGVKFGRRGQLQIRAAKGGEEGGTTFKNTIFGMVAKNANYMSLGSALAKGGLQDTLDGEDEYTIFAPNDDAFDLWSKELGVTKMEIMELDNLPDILKNHVVKGKVMAADIPSGTELDTVGGGKLKFGDGSVNGVTITKTDIKVDNGILHAVKSVLVPAQ